MRSSDDFRYRFQLIRKTTMRQFINSYKDLLLMSHKSVYKDRVKMAFLIYIFLAIGHILGIHLC